MRKTLLVAAIVAVIIIAITAFSLLLDTVSPSPPMNLKISVATRADMEKHPIIDAATGKVVDK